MLRKRILAVAASAMMGVAMVSGTCMSANAYTTSTSYGSFEWNTTYSRTTNTTNNSRRVAAYIMVYRDNTGTYVTSGGKENIGSYGTYAKATVSSYSRTGYNFKCSGIVYNSTNSNSGKASEFVKYLD